VTRPPAGEVIVAKRRKPGPSEGHAISGVAAVEEGEEEEEMEEEDKSRRRRGDAERVNREVMMESSVSKHAHVLRLSQNWIDMAENHRLKKKKKKY